MPELLKPPLYWIKLGRVGRKAQEAYVLGTDDLPRAMTWSTVEHEKKVMIRVGFGELVEETLQASTVHPRKIKAEALSRSGFNRRIEVGPLVGTFDDVGRTKPLRAVASPVPIDQAKTRLVKG